MVEQGLTLLYTANILGRLDRLPRLFSLIQQVRAAAGTPTLLLDLGHSCAPDAAVCAATEGRAALLVFDAMGYDGACLTATECRQMGDSALAKLRDTVQMALCGPLVDTGGTLPALADWQREPFQVCLGPAMSDDSSGVEVSSKGPTGARVVLRPDFAAATNHWDPAARLLRLAPPPGDGVGCATFVCAPDQELTVYFEITSLTADHQPDSTVAAAVDFVKEEARFYRQHARQQAHDMGGMT